MSAQPRDLIFSTRWTPFIHTNGSSKVPRLPSWQALSLVNISDVRLTYTQDTPELKEAFAIDYANCYAAKLTANINAGPQWTDVAGNRIRPDPSAIEAWAFEMATKYPARIYTFDNEPGNLAQLHEAQHPGSDFMVEAYMPAFLAFVRGVLRANPKALFGGCDADSVEIQAKFIALCKKFLSPEVFKRLRRRVHPYGDGFADQRYSTWLGDNENDGYATQADNLPIDIGEIGVGSNNYMQIPTDAELQQLFDYVVLAGSRIPLIGEIGLGCPQDFFDRFDVILAWPPPDPPKVPSDTWSTFNTDAPIISDYGRKVRDHIAKVNGLKSGRLPGRGR